jgi:hypothetical protein
MPDIPLEVRALDFITNQSVPVRAWRAFVEARFIAANGRPTRFQTFVDPGAPFGMVPHSLWHSRRLRWTPLGTQLIRAGKPVPGALSWQGVPCDLGATELYLIDLDSGIRTGPHQLVAKFPRRRLPPAAENAAILGMNFLADNDIRLVLESNHGAVSGYLAVPGA